MEHDLVSRSQSSKASSPGISIPSRNSPAFAVMPPTCRISTSTKERLRRIHGNRNAAAEPPSFRSISGGDIVHAAVLPGPAHVQAIPTTFPEAKTASAHPFQLLKAAPAEIGRAHV